MARLELIAASVLGLALALASACSDGGSHGKGGQTRGPGDAKNCEAQSPAASPSTLHLQDEDPLVNLSAPVAFQPTILSLVAQHCVSCHAGGIDDAPILPLFQYQELAANNFRIARQMADEVTAGRMPKASVGATPMQAVSRLLFRRWALAGFPETVADAAPPAGTPQEDPSSNAVTYASHISAVISSICLQCHAKDQQEPDLTTFELLSANDYDVAKKVVEEVLEGDMPRPDPLPEAQLELFRQWRDGGYRKDAASPGAPQAPGPAPGQPAGTVETEGEISTCIPG
jgi:mono/diheme cytochrome c family protein